MWYQLMVNGDLSCVDALSEQLNVLEALSITYTDQEDNPVLEPTPGTTPLWQKTVITALFDDEAKRDVALLQLKITWPTLFYAVNTLEDEAWERAWMVDFKPMCFGRRLWVCPSFEEVVDDNAVNVILTPGMAFGTGTHPTTRLCLQYLDSVNLSQKTVCDFGCGSGILAIAALKLGARYAYLVDIDEQALVASKENAMKNHIDNEYYALQLADDFTCPKVDLVFANILALPLMELAKKLTSLLKPAGVIVLSGVLEEQLHDLLATYEQYVSLISTTSEKDWQCIVANKKITS